MSVYHNEIDKDCLKVLRKHFPESVVDGRSIEDVKTREVKEYRQCHFFAGIGGFSLGFERCAPDVNVWTGGFPCQDLSVAGKRAGLAGKRSGLYFALHRLVIDALPRWVVLENVPGLLSSNEGRDFAIVVGGLTGVVPEVPEAGWGNAGFFRGAVYSVAYRVLDAQFFGVPQRRRRVFVVASLGDGRCAEVLFEREGMCRDTPARESKGQGFTPDVVGSLDAGGSGGRNAHGGAWPGTTVQSMSAGHSFPVEISPTLSFSNTNDHYDPSQQAYIPETFTMRGGKDGGGKGYLGSVDQSLPLGPQELYVMAHGQANVETISDGSPSLTRNHEAPILFDVRNSATSDEVSSTLQAKESGGQSLNCQPVVWEMSHADEAVRESGDQSPTLQARMGTGGNQVPLVGVRRLTPIECARLQGFPDDWGAGQSDSAQYRQYGNAVAVPVIEWLVTRIKNADVNT